MIVYSSAHPLQILFASRLVHEKGVDILISVTNQIATMDGLKGKIQWHIVSDGPYQETIRELAKEYPNIKYHGQVSKEELSDLYRKADLLYMPSRFLETFGLTAAEAIASGTSVCGFAKGGLTPFIGESLRIDEASPIDDSIRLIQSILSGDVLLGTMLLPEIYTLKFWSERLREISVDKENILILHDYRERIGGAEGYVENVEESLRKLGKNVTFFGYFGDTSIWKRRIFFITNIFAFWRYYQLMNVLKSSKPDLIWMHSIMRYVGPWGILAIRYYSRLSPSTDIILAHHDVGLLAAFPQYIYQESQIPQSRMLRAFISQGTGIIASLIASTKWIYREIIIRLIPAKTRQMIFAPFLEENIRGIFTGSDIIVFPHGIDTEIFHPEGGS